MTWKNPGKDQELNQSIYDNIGEDTANNSAATTLVTANRDGSVLERLEHILDVILDDETTNPLGVDDSNNAFASTNVAANADGSILERLEYIQANATPQTPATFVPGLGFRVTKTENVNTATGVDLFTVTGKVLVTLWTLEVTNALDAAVTDYKLRVKTSNIDLCAASNIASAAIGFIVQMNSDAGDTLINTASATETADTNGKGLANRIVGKASGTLTLQSNRTAGASGDEVIHVLFYLPLEASASVAAA